MKNRWFARGLAAVGLMGACVAPAVAGYDETTDPDTGRSTVQRLNADPSPNPAASGINNYINQDEQLNLSSKDGVVKVLRTDQKIMLNDYVTAVFPIRYATPREMRNVMRVVTGIEGGRAEVIQDKVSKQFFMQVMAPGYMIPYLRDTVAALDVPWLKEYWDGAQDIYYKAQHRDAADVDLIASRFGGDDAVSVIDTTNNAVRRYDEEYRNKEYAKAAEMVDIPANQVLLDVKMYEVAANNDTKLGLDYVNWRNGPGRNLFQFVYTAFDADQRAKALTSVFDPFLDARSAGPDDTRRVLDSALVTQYQSVNYLLTSNYVDFLQSRGKARVVASQQILAVSSRPATITAERRVLAIVNNENDLDTVEPDRDTLVVVRENNGNEVDVFSPGGARGRVIADAGDAPDEVAVEDSRRRVNVRNAGVATTELTVTPFVGLESMELDLELEIDDVNGVAPSGLPIINKRVVSTTVRLLDGQPYVIAGIKRSTISKNSGKVPFLGDIPVIGYAFGGETNLKRENRVVITITPHFILSTQKSIAKAPEVETLKAIVDGRAPLATPESTPGYDQWLLGRLSM